MAIQWLVIWMQGVNSICSAKTFSKSLRVFYILEINRDALGLSLILF